jgi:hypothetical protein
MPHLLLPLHLLMHLRTPAPALVPVPAPLPPPSNPSHKRGAGVEGHVLQDLLQVSCSPPPTPNHNCKRAIETDVSPAKFTANDVTMHKIWSSRREFASNFSRFDFEFWLRGFVVYQEIQMLLLEQNVDKVDWTYLSGNNQLLCYLLFDVLLDNYFL